MRQGLAQAFYTFGVCCGNSAGTKEVVRVSRATVKGNELRR